MVRIDLFKAKTITFEDIHCLICELICSDWVYLYAQIFHIF